MENKETASVVGYGKRMSIGHEGFGVGGAVLDMDAGKKTDMVFHRVNGKLLYLLSGNLKVVVLRDGVASSVNVEAGMSFYVRPGLVYQLEAVSRAIVIEFAQPEAFSSDIYCITKGSQAVATPSVVDSLRLQGTQQTAQTASEPAVEAPVAEKSVTKKTKKSKKGLN
jgi:mannose-6-phosphate isomerase-like protein (cupin superfamily)